MTPLRDDLIAALTFADLAEGKGSPKQQLAYQELEWRRCAADPAYFLSRYGYIKLKDGSIAKWVLWPLQMKLLADFIEGKSIIAVKARQLGVTTLTTHYFLWKVIFSDAAQCHLVSDSEAKAKEAISRVRITLDRLPEWMKARARCSGGLKDIIDRKDKSNSRTAISFGYSEFTIRTSTPNSVAGLTGCIALDEFSRHREQEAVYDNVIPAVDGGGQLIIIANGQGEDEFHALYHSAKRGENGMVPYFFSWADDPSRDEAWYETTKKRYLRDNPDRNIWNFRAQYPSNEQEAFYLSSDSRFNLEALQGYSLLLQTKPHPKPRRGFVEAVGGGYQFAESGRAGALTVFEEPVKGGVYIMGVDPAGGGQSSDYSVIQICRLYQHDPEGVDALVRRYGYDEPPRIDNKDAFEYRLGTAMLEQVAAYRGKSEPTLVGYQAMRIGEWYNGALAVVELNQHGGTVVDRMKDNYHNLYREVKNEKFSDEESERLGYWTDKHSKMEMIDSLAEWLDSAWIALRDKTTITELSQYGYQTNSAGTQKLGCPKGMNDDLVIGLALCVVGARSLIQTRSANPRKTYAPWQW